MIFSYDLLIADEERVVSDLLKEQFDFLGDFTPFSAGSGREVLEFIKKRHFDFLILALSNCLLLCHHLGAFLVHMY